MGGISTTRAGTLLKHQIPIRTIQEWKETQPGFLEADLVAHCGMDSEGGHVYTLTPTSRQLASHQEGRCLPKPCVRNVVKRSAEPSRP